MDKPKNKLGNGYEITEKGLKMLEYCLNILKDKQDTHNDVFDKILEVFQEKYNMSYKEAAANYVGTISLMLTGSKEELGLDEI